MVKNLPAMQETGFDLGSGRSPGEGNGNPLQYSWLENSMDRRAWWWATVHGVPKSQTQLSYGSNCGGVWISWGQLYFDDVGGCRSFEQDNSTQQHIFQELAMWALLSARKTKTKKHIPFPLGACSLGSEVSHLYFRNVIVSIYMMHGSGKRVEIRRLIRKKLQIRGKGLYLGK